MNRMLPRVLGSAALAVCLAQAAQAQCPGNLEWPFGAPAYEPRYQVAWGGQIGGDHHGDGMCHEPTPVRCVNNYTSPNPETLNWVIEGTAGRGVWSIDQHSWGGNYGNMGSNGRVTTSGWVTFTAPPNVTTIPNVWMTFDIDASIHESDCCSGTQHTFAVGFPTTQQWLDGGRLNHDASGWGCGTGVFSEGVIFDGLTATFARRVVVGPFTVPVGVPVNIGVRYFISTGAGGIHFDVHHTAYVALPTDAPVFILPEGAYSAASADFGIVDNWWSDPRVVVTDQPDNAIGCVGGTVELSVGADGEGPIAYAWRKDGTGLVNGPTPDGSIVSGADTATLSISNAHGSDAGTYDCVVSNTYGPAECDPALLSFCLGDFACDGELNFFDVQMFLAAFANHDPIADINNDGAFNFFDALAYLRAFDEGCP